MLAYSIKIEFSVLNYKKLMNYTKKKSFSYT